MSACKIVKLPYTIVKGVGQDIGEAVGLSKGEGEQKVEPVVDENGKIIVDKDGKVIIKRPTSNKTSITSETVGNLLWYCTITLAVLFAIRYGVKKFTRKDE